MRRMPLALLASAVLAAMLLVGSFPLSTWMAQRHQISALSAQLRSIQRQNAALRSEAAKLSQPRYVGHLARSRYGLVPKGSRAYVVIPAPSKSTSPTRQKG